MHLVLEEFTVLSEDMSRGRQKYTRATGPGGGWEQIFFSKSIGNSGGQHNGGKWCHCAGGTQTTLALKSNRLIFTSCQRIVNVP